MEERACNILFGCLSEVRRVLLFNHDSAQCRQTASSSSRADTMTAMMESAHTTHSKDLTFSAQPNHRA